MSALPAFLLLVLAWATAVQPAAAAEQPNIIFLLADDLGYADLACYGHPYAVTPNLDRLASEGTRFRQFHVTGFTCCPSRTGFMTGRHPATFATNPASGGFGDRVTVTGLLKKAGYATGHVGKWHIGPDESPGTYGIDVTPGSPATAGVGMRKDERGRDAHLYDDAIRFIEKHQGGPFYLNVWGHISHNPVDPLPVLTERFKDLVVDESAFSATMREKFAIAKARGGDLSVGMRNYLAEVHALDAAVGRLLKRLDELGLRHKTIVVFSSDHGSPAMRPPGEEDKPAKKEKKEKKPDAANPDARDLTLNLMGYNGTLRGGKHGMYEGGVRAPFIVRWPEHVPAGRVDESSLLSGLDWLPTLCRLANVQIDATSFDGEDTSACWLGGVHVRAQPLRWKTSAIGSAAGINDGRWKLLQATRRRGEMELYDLLNDPAEQRNVAADHPEEVQRLTDVVEAWIATLPKEYVKGDDRED